MKYTAECEFEVLEKHRYDRNVEFILYSIYEPFHSIATRVGTFSYAHFSRIYSKSVQKQAKMQAFPNKYNVLLSLSQT